MISTVSVAMLLAQPQPVEFLRIGRTGGPPIYRLGDVTGIEIIGDEVYVLNGVTNSVRVFHRDGDIRREIGGEQRRRFGGIRRLRRRNSPAIRSSPLLSTCW